MIRNRCQKSQQMSVFIKYTVHERDFKNKNNTLINDTKTQKS